MPPCHNIYIKECVTISKGGIGMEIASLNSALSLYEATPSDSLASVTSLEMLDNAMELNEQMSQDMIKMMENSVTPHLGSNIDISI